MGRSSNLSQLGGLSKTFAAEVTQLVVVAADVEVVSFAGAALDVVVCAVDGDSNVVAFVVLILVCMLLQRHLMLMLLLC